MKDKQTKSGAVASSIPVISPVLHFFAMPVLVFWRRSFGYAFLSPKSVFLATIISCSLLSYMVWHEPGLKPHYATLSAFSLTASFFYLVHLILSLGKQARKKAEHDQYSGTSNLLAFLPAEKRSANERFIHCVVEPALTIFAGVLLTKSALQSFLMVSGFSLGLKEIINTWLGIRRQKSLRDNLDDATETMEAQIAPSTAPLPSSKRTRWTAPLREPGKSDKP